MFRVKPIFIPKWFCALFALVITSLAQSPQIKENKFEQGDLRFTYPLDWKLNDKSTADVQYIVLGKPDLLPLIVVVSPREIMKNFDQFFGIEESMKSRFFTPIENALEVPGKPTERENACMDLNGRRVAGTRIKGAYMDEPAILDIYPVALGYRFIGLVYLRSIKDEVTSDFVWRDFVRSLSLNGATHEFPPLTLRNGGVVNGKALRLIKPSYPKAAGGARGLVKVAITIDERGKVVSAKIEDGAQVFSAEAIWAAKQSEFPPTLVCGQGIRVNATIIYNFNP